MQANQTPLVTLGPGGDFSRDFVAARGVRPLRRLFSRSRHRNATPEAASCEREAGVSGSVEGLRRLGHLTLAAEALLGQVSDLRSLVESLRARPTHHHTRRPSGSPSHSSLFASV